MYSLIVTAKMNYVDLQAWLADVLARIGEHPATGSTQRHPSAAEKQTVNHGKFSASPPSSARCKRSSVSSPIHFETTTVAKMLLNKLVTARISDMKRSTPKSRGQTRCR
jgi:hypothetical protein